MDGIDIFTTQGGLKMTLLEAKTEETQKTLADEQAKVQALTQEQRGEVGCHLGKICQDWSIDPTKWLVWLVISARKLILPGALMWDMRDVVIL